MEKQKVNNPGPDPSNTVLWTIVISLVGALIAGIVFVELRNKAAVITTVSGFDQMAYEKHKEKIALMEEVDSWWKVPELREIKDPKERDLVKYGRDLIMHTSRYLGPNGSVKNLSNGMNCQNCHLDAGTKPWGNNYAAVASTYPKVRARSGQMESIEKRVNDCFERSLNGEALDNDSKEMRAIVAYMKFLGKYVKKGETPEGSGIFNIPFLDRPADPVRGETIYADKCASCHGANGEGMLAMDQREYTYPPLWGPNSYNSGARLFRLSRLAGYVKYNMPFGASWLEPQMSDEDSWDVAAFINTQERPGKDISKDWPDISKKPIDHPFGPYSDGFSEIQHKLGPFGPIKKAKEANQN
jgi:thiosulfate dehydrogenase